MEFPHRYVMKPTNEELVDLYCSSTVAVCPSWYESFPAPPLEAMTCGTPTVTTSIGVEDYAVHGQNSLVVEPRSPEQLAQSIVKLIKDEALRNTLISGGLETAKRFSWDKTAVNIERLFTESLQNHQPSRIIRVLGK